MKRHCRKKEKTAAVAAGKEEKVANILLGIGLGIAIHRFIMALVLNSSPDTTCAYCRWIGGKGRHKQ